MTTVLHNALFHLLLPWLVSSSLSFKTPINPVVKTSPESPVVEIGKNFTATCILVNPRDASVDDLVWYSSLGMIPREQYTKINTTAVNVTIAITRETPSWLYCEYKKTPTGSPVAKHMDGIRLRRGYAPEKPENLSCIAVQVDNHISPNITCSWDNTTPESPEIITTNRLYVNIVEEIQIDVYGETSGQVSLDVFPHHMVVKVWVKSENKLGMVQSDVLETVADRFVKTNPPSKMKVFSEKRFPTSLLINWTQPIAKAYVKLSYHIRFTAQGSHVWFEVPSEDTSKDIQSFRLQYLRPDTDYVTQVRCKIVGEEDYGYWSDWSQNATTRTPEDRPKSKPDLWWTISNDTSGNKPMVHILCKDPVLSNGKIKSFDIKTPNHPLENVAVNAVESGPRWPRMTPVDLKQLEYIKQSVYVEVIAHNSVGHSPKAMLKITRSLRDFPPVDQLKWSSHEGKLWIEWQSPNISAGGAFLKHNVTEYVVQWVSLNDGQIDWQREPANTVKTVIRGDLKKFTCYNISVYPLYSEWVGQAVAIAAYVEQGDPLEAPVVRLKEPGNNDALLVWKEIPQEKRHGFIVNYTVYYSVVNGSEMRVVSLPADAYSYHLKGLSSNTKYCVKVKASTIQGSAISPDHMFNTTKYAPGQIKGIVVGVCLVFLFLVIITMILCFKKRDSIQSKLWPTIPNPGNSRIGAWSPDFHLINDAAKDNTLADMSVVQVDVLEGNSVFEEDKTGLPLKKDKYLSEEHSSGIGDSSCMSSPRQSVSDSDEGGDLGDTTASTVQYSSVVASQGYKGQQPASQQQQQQHAPSFSRSESTQPLLDCEGGDSDMLGSSGQSQRSLSPGTPGYRSSAFKVASTDSAEESGGPSPGEPESAVLVRFWPLEEPGQQSCASDAVESTELLEAGLHGMTKSAGYRPQ